ncbi:MAG: hypothetical protein ABL959_15825, partial [Pyrinomonadaceae bacterium]
MKKIETTPAGRASQILESLTAEKIEAMTKRTSLSTSLEMLDPSKDHTDGSDAFERVLLAAGVTPRSVPEYGIQATTLAELNDMPKARFLISEIISRGYRKVAFATERGSLNTSQDATLGSLLNQYAFAGPRFPQLTAAIPVSELVALTTGIQQNYYRPFILNDIADEEVVNNRVSEGSEIPAIEITNAEKQLTLHKVGRRLDVTYEALRQVPIDLMSYFVQRIAIRIEADKVNTIIATLISGDGNAGTAATNYNLTSLDAGTTANNMTVKAWLAFKMKFKNPFLATHAFAREDDVLKLMMLNTGSANVPLNNGGSLFAAQQFQPINQGLSDGVRVGWLDAVPANKILAIDKRVAVERIFEIGSTIKEVDRWIREQKESLV